MSAALLAAGESTIGPTLAVIVGTGMAAQWLAWRMQIPSIIALLLAGLVLGPVTGVLDPDELLGGTLFPLVSLSVALILFEGGLDLPPRELRNTGTVVRRLITVGAVVCFLIGWYASREIFGISNQAAIVLGAVLVVTGPTVVGPLLRFVRPAGTTGPILRAEGVLIDPIGATAALLAFEIVILEDANEAVVKVAVVLLLTIVAGAGVGLLAAYVLDEALRRFLIPDQLIVPVTFAFVVATFVAANEIQEESGPADRDGARHVPGATGDVDGSTCPRVQRESANAADFCALHPARCAHRGRPASRGALACARVPRRDGVHCPATLGPRVDGSYIAELA